MPEFSRKIGRQSKTFIRFSNGISAEVYRDSGLGGGEKETFDHTTPEGKIIKCTDRFRTKDVSFTMPETGGVRKAFKSAMDSGDLLDFNYWVENGAGESVDNADAIECEVIDVVKDDGDRNTTAASTVTVSLTVGEWLDR